MLAVHGSSKMVVTLFASLQSGGGGLRKGSPKIAAKITKNCFTGKQIKVCVQLYGFCT